MALGLPAYNQEKRKHGLANKAACEEIVKDALKELPWIEIGYIKEAFDYRSLGSILTFAERILVYVGETEILVKSSCLFPGQFIDFGKNKRNVHDFFQTFERLKQ